LHRRAADLVDAPVALDHRIAGALVEDDALAVAAEAQAQVEADAGQARLAADHLVAASRLTTSGPERERLILDSVELLLRCGEVPVAAAVAQKAGCFADTPRRRHVLGRLAFLTGRQAEAESLLTSACEQAELVGDTARAAMASATVAHLYSVQMRWEECVEWARRSVAAGEVDLTSLARSLLVVGPAMAGRSDEGLRLAEEVADPGFGFDVMTGRGLVRMWVDDLVAARADLAAVVDAARPGLASPRGLVALGWLCECEYRMGAWDDSLVHGALAVSLATDTDQVWLAPFIRAQACWVAAARGSWDMAEDHVAAAHAAATQVGDAAGVGYAAIAEAHLAFCRSQPARLIEAVQPFLHRCEWQAVREPSVLPWREFYAWALLSTQRLDEAEAVLAQLDEPGVASRRSSSARALRLKAEIQASRGEEDAEPSLRQALEQLDELSMPFERALTEESYGRWLRRRGKRRQAVDHLEAARDGFAHLGAAPFADRTAGELAACGVGKRHPPVENPDLTTQELAVAHLVASGLTNRQVAQELVLSVKTVEYHLGHLYPKLGVTSRSQLARRFAASSTRDPSRSGTQE